MQFDIDGNDNPPVPSAGDDLGRMGRIALAGLIGLPALAGAAEPAASALEVYCTEDEDTVAMLESGSAATQLFFGNPPDAARESAAAAGARACFPLGAEENYFYETHTPRGAIFLYSWDTAMYFLERIPPPLLVEGEEGSSHFTVFRVGKIDIPGSIDLTLGGTATPGVDYRMPDTMASGAGTTETLRFAAGETTKSITVDLLDDGDPEEDETIEVTLSSPTTLPGLRATVGVVLDGGTNQWNTFTRVSYDPPIRAGVVILDDDTRRSLAPPHWCTTHPDKVNPLIDDGSSAVDVWFSSDPGLASGTGIYCASSWDCFYVDDRDNTRHSCNFPQSGSISNLSSSISAQSSSVSTLSSNVSTLSSSISTLSSNISVQSSSIATTPRIIRINAGNASASIFVIGTTGPYTAICTPEGGGAPVHATAAVSPVEVQGLANGVEYDCVVAGSGSSAVSAPGTVTPSATPGAWPISALGPWSLALLSGVLGVFGALMGRRSR